MENILTIHTSNAVCNEKGYVFIATNLTEGENQPEETEVLELKKLPFVEVYKMAMNGEITDSLSLAGIFKTHTLLKQKGVL